MFECIMHHVLSYSDYCLYSCLRIYARDRGITLRAIIGDLSYEEYIPDTKQLHLLKTDAPQAYKTYWRYCVIFILALKRSGGGLEELSKCRRLNLIPEFERKIMLSILTGDQH